MWLITSVSNDLGFLLTLRALKAGHHAAAGHLVEMDMTESQTIIHSNIRAVGHIDYPDDITGLMYADIFGPIYTIQAALQIMRPRRAGTIINIYSVAAQGPLPARLVRPALYAASKAAVEAMTEALRKEVESFNIKFLVVQPGSLRTNFMRGIRTCANPMPLIDRFKLYDGGQPNNPEKAAERIFEIVTRQCIGGGQSGKVQRLALGEDALSCVQQSCERQAHDIALGEEVARRHRV
ncbi:putative short-chain dehydrogenase [Xylariaceae sp. FL0255]|nr:putative short-chain dehydrogenase [Xylariaceae sp. FL0255]